MIREGASRLLIPAVRTAVQQRSQSVIAGPPRVKVSSAEKLILGGGMCAAMLIIPAWVVYRIPSWRGVK